MLDIKHILTYTWQSPPQGISPLWSDKLKVQTTHLHNCQILAKKDVLDTSLVSWQNISWILKTFDHKKSHTNLQTKTVSNETEVLNIGSKNYHSQTCKSLQPCNLWHY